MRIQPETFKNIRRTILFFSLTAGMILLIFKYGLVTAVKISEFLQKNQPGYEETPLDSFLPAPTLLATLEATNSGQLAISGYGPANKEVVVTLNEIENVPLTVDSEGKFSGNLGLALGINTFYAATRDFNGNLSPKTATQTVYYSNTPPFIEIIDPLPESVIKNNPDIVLKGKTEISSKIYINDHLVLVEADGNFSYTTKLTKGDNLFKIISVDPAQNQTQKEFMLQFRP